MTDLLMLFLVGGVFGISFGSLLNGIWELILYAGKGYQLQYFRYLFFDFTRQNKILCFTFCKPTSICQCVGTKQELLQMSQKERRREELQFAIADLAGKWILAVLLIILMMIVWGHNRILVCFVCGVTSAVCLLTVIHTISAMRMFVGFDDSLIAKVQEISKNFLAGIPLSQMQFQPLENITLKKNRYAEQMYQHFHFLYCMETDNLHTMKNIAIWMESHVSDSVLKPEIPLYYDIIYYYACVEMNRHKVQSYYRQVENELANDKDSNGRRVLAYYQYYVESQPEKALETAKEGIRVIDWFEGNKEFEEKFLERLINEIQSKKG